MAVLVYVGIAALVLFVFLLFDSVASVLGNAIIAILYLFTMANFPTELNGISVFYAIMVLFNLVMDMTPFRAKVNATTPNTVTIINSPIPYLHIAFGVLLTFVFALLSTGARAQIFGTPTLASGIGLLAPVSGGIILAARGLVGPAENRFATIMSNMIEKVLPFGPFLSIPLAAFGMGLFHSFAYAAQGIASILFPTMAFMIIIAIIRFTQEDTAPNVAHYLYNVLININRSLVVRI